MPPKYTCSIPELQEQVRKEILNIYKFFCFGKLLGIGYVNWWENKFVFKSRSGKESWNGPAATLGTIIWRRVERWQPCVEG
jgi:hypothetical protein